MHGFWRTLVTHYRSLGGQLRTGTAVSRVDGGPDGFTVHTRRGVVGAGQVVLAVPAEVSARVCPRLMPRLLPYLDRDRPELGGAVLVFLGVPADEVSGQAFTHHQLMHSYARPLGDGNNMFVSVSAAGDEVSAPAGHRAVMISTHTALSSWADLDDEEYAQHKKELSERLVGLARRVYPRLGDRAVVMDVGTPRTYQRFGFRPDGAVGNQFAIPHDLGGRGLWLVGDSTWPGLGTVACVLGSRIVADGVQRERRRGR
jgi:phytoene dehydrogenase-like protein